MTDTLNLAGVLPVDTFDLSINFPNSNKPTGWVITLAGPAHPKSRALADGAGRKRLRKSAEIQRAQINGRKWKGDEDRTPDEDRREFVSGIVARIVSWSPDPDFGDGKIAFTDEAATELFMNPKLGSFFSQIVDYLISDQAFIPASAQV